jgi:NADH dehydrogenase
VRSQPNVFVIGDAATIEHLDPPVPGIAPAAKQMGGYVADCIARRSRGEAADAPFRYRHHGDLATIGRRRAIVLLDHFKLTGFAGWVFWGSAHIYFLIGTRNRFVVAFNWLWDYITLQRGARLIIDPPTEQSQIMTK